MCFEEICLVEIRTRLSGNEKRSRAETHSPDPVEEAVIREYGICGLLREWNPRTKKAPVERTEPRVGFGIGVAPLDQIPRGAIRAYSTSPVACPSLPSLNPSPSTPRRYCRAWLHPGIASQDLRLTSAEIEGIVARRELLPEPLVGRVRIDQS